MPGVHATGVPFPPPGVGAPPVPSPLGPPDPPEPLPPLGLAPPVPDEEVDEPPEPVAPGPALPVASTLPVQPPARRAITKRGLVHLNIARTSLGVVVRTDLDRVAQTGARLPTTSRQREIGRASCRERA